jgi:hypothetical protein
MVKKENNKISLGALGVIISVIGLILAFRIETSTIWFFISLAMVVGGIILVAKSFND